MPQDANSNQIVFFSWGTKHPKEKANSLAAFFLGGDSYPNDFWVAPFHCGFLATLLVPNYSYCSIQGLQSYKATSPPQLYHLKHAEKNNVSSLYYIRPL